MSRQPTIVKSSTYFRTLGRCLPKVIICMKLEAQVIKKPPWPIGIGINQTAMPGARVRIPRNFLTFLIATLFLQRFNLVY